MRSSSLDQGVRNFSSPSVGLAIIAAWTGIALRIPFELVTEMGVQKCLCGSHSASALTCKQYMTKGVLIPWVHPLINNFQIIPRN